MIVVDTVDLTTGAGRLVASAITAAVRVAERYADSGLVLTGAFLVVLAERVGTTEHLDA